MTAAANTYAQLSLELNRIQRELREKRMEAFRMAITTIRGKTRMSPSDRMLSNLYDGLLELRKSRKLTAGEDIDELLELVDEFLHLEDICLLLDEKPQ